MYVEEDFVSSSPTVIESLLQEYTSGLGRPRLRPFAAVLANMEDSNELLQLVECRDLGIALPPTASQGEHGDLPTFSPAKTRMLPHGLLPSPSERGPRDNQCPGNQFDATREEQIRTDPTLIQF